MLRLPRLIPRLDIKGNHVIKGINLEGLRVVGKPAELARRYALDADELLYIDAVASLYGRNALAPLVEEATRDVFIPITVGGGIRSRADVDRLLRSGADKVAINTAAIANPTLLADLAQHYGSQAIVLSIEAKRGPLGWECFTDGGRQATGRCAQRWAQEAVSLGCGEILLTSIDRDGTRKGFDHELLEAIAPEVDVPVVISGGMGKLSDMEKVKGAHGIAMASVLHYNILTIGEMR